ncbi:Hypothetical predicted protein, partial [Marmota monax]
MVNEENEFNHLTSLPRWMLMAGTERNTGREEEPKRRASSHRWRLLASNKPQQANFPGMDE